MTFRWNSPVFFDELDLNGSLHNARFAVHVERAQSALFEGLGLAWNDPAERDADLHYVVRELHVEFLAPFSAPGLLPVELTADRIGTTSAVYRFRCGDEVTYATGYRAIVKVDPTTGRPVPWSERYRATFASLAAASDTGTKAESDVGTTSEAKSDVWTTSEAESDVWTTSEAETDV